MVMEKHSYTSYGGKLEVIIIEKRSDQFGMIQQCLIRVFKCFLLQREMLIKILHDPLQFLYPHLLILLKLINTIC